MIKIILKIIILILFSNSLFAHSGGLNGQGCHNNKKTGGYHCHRTPGWNTGEYPNRSVSSYQCRLMINNQYYDFDPAQMSNMDLKFDSNNGNVKLNCNRK